MQTLWNVFSSRSTKFQIQAMVFCEFSTFCQSPQKNPIPASFMKPHQNLLYHPNTSIHSFTSEYHHESRCLNLLNRSPTLVWFTDNLAPLPQHVIIKLPFTTQLNRLGFYIHGENNQNPRKVEIWTSLDEKEWKRVVQDEFEKKAGDRVYSVDEKAQFVKYRICSNYGGSGVHVSKLFAFGKEIKSE